MEHKRLVAILTIVVIGIALITMSNPVRMNNASEIPYSKFLNAVDGNSVQSVEIGDMVIKGKLKDGHAFVTINPGDYKIVDRLKEKDILIKGVLPKRPSMLSTILMSWGPMLLLIGVWIYFMRKQMGGKGGVFSFGKSRANMVKPNENSVTFDDVAGIDEAKAELEEIVDFLKSPEKFYNIGGRIPKGVLLTGQPGTGKTLLARAIAGEAQVPFFSASGSDFVEMFVGVGAARMRDMFEQAKKNAPCIVFIDEIDAVGRKRGANLGGNEEREQTLNQMLVEMDGFRPSLGVIVIAATNRVDVLDQALLRPGRFDRQVVVPLPDLLGREKILATHVKRIVFAKTVSLRVIARMTPGFSGADLANLVNEAAIFAARSGKSEVDMDDFVKARDRILLGAERKSAIMPDDERETTAWHESGHAVVACHLPHVDPVHKVTIIPHGMALGVTMQLPKEDRHGLSKEELFERICVLMAGREAERLFTKSITTGAANDIERATDMARRMVTQWGMADNLPPLMFDDKELEYGAHRSKWSESTLKALDDAVFDIIREAEEKTRAILCDHKEEVARMAALLLEKETIDEADISAITQCQT